MKLFFITVVFMVCTGGLFAQHALWQNFPPDIKWDIGFNYGGSEITRPLGPDRNYQGTRTNIVPDYTLKVAYAANPNWIFAFEMGMRKWESFGTWSEPYLMGTTLKNENITFGLGRPALTESFQANYAIPFYNKFSVVNKASLYFGINLGLVETVSDGSVGYSHYNAPPDSAYRFVSSYNYGSGIGFSFGVQAGYTWYFWKRFGLNAEIAAKYVNVATETVNGLNYAHITNNYHMMYFPESIGLRYRFK